MIKRKLKMAINLVSGVAVVCAVVGLVYLTASSAMFERFWKSTKSNYGGGLHRTVTVYDMEGRAIKTYEGTFDIKESDNHVFFDNDGKRTQIYNATVISDEN